MTSEGHVTLLWQDPEDDTITGYRVLRGPDADSLAVIREDTGPNAISYTDTEAEAGQTHAYAVEARNAAGLSPISNTLTASVPSTEEEEVLIAQQQSDSTDEDELFSEIAYGSSPWGKSVYRYEWFSLSEGVLYQLDWGRAIHYGGMNDRLNVDLIHIFSPNWIVSQFEKTRRIFIAPATGTYTFEMKVSAPPGEGLEPGYYMSVTEIPFDAMDIVETPAYASDLPASTATTGRASLDHLVYLFGHNSAENYQMYGDDTDYDWLAIELEQFGTYRFACSGFYNNKPIFKIHIWVTGIYDSEGALIGEGYNRGGIRFSEGSDEPSTWSKRLCPNYGFTAPEDGTYYVSVKLEIISHRGDRSGFGLGVTKEDDCTGTTDTNCEVARYSASEYEIEAVGADVDWIRMPDLLANRRYKIRLSERPYPFSYLRPDDYTMPLEIESLYDADGNEISGENAGTTTTQVGTSHRGPWDSPSRTLIFETTVAGDYFLSVKGHEGGSSQYKVILTLLQDDSAPAE